MASTVRWILPYIDQPLEFWRHLAAQYGKRISEIYFPLALEDVGTGRPSQPARHLNELLASSLFKTSVLINPLILPQPVETLAEPILKALNDLIARYGIKGVTLTNPNLGRLIRNAFPNLHLTASVLMDIHSPLQVSMIGDIFDGLVPSSRIMRDLASLKQVRSAFKGKIRLLLNEACLPGCPFRPQHFYEMGSKDILPQSLCNELLEQKPWLSLTGAWVLPQHLELYQGLFDELKLAGRVTLKNPAYYLEVTDAYINGKPLTPDKIGGGPASVKEPLLINQNFMIKTLNCSRDCHQCDYCKHYYQKVKRSAP